MQQFDPRDRCCWVGCHAPSADEFDLCESHYAAAGQSYIEQRSIWGSKFQEANRESKAAINAARRTEVATRQDERRSRLNAQSVVYYVRTGNHVKIGFTINLRQRLSGLRLNDDAVLATEPGGRVLERQRHLEFANERVGRREDFNPSRRLLAHIDAIVELHGEPIITDFKTAAS